MRHGSKKLNFESVHLYQSPISLNESRIFRETKALTETQRVNRCLIVGFQDQGAKRLVRPQKRALVCRIPLKFRYPRFRRLLRGIYLIELMVRIAWFMRRVDYKIIHCHGLTLLPLSAFLKLFYGGKIIFDAHELETEKNGLKGVTRQIFKVVERLFIGSCDAILLVGDEIADWYRTTYGPRVAEKTYILRNIPPRPPSNLPVRSSTPVRTLYGLKPHDLLFLYQGLLCEGRAIHIMLEAFARGPSDRHLLMLGYGDFEPMCREYAARYPHIHFHPAVPASELLAITRQADIGLCIIEDICLSYRYSLPNKFFEYLMCGIPMIVNEVTTMARFVDRDAFGWKTPATPQALGTLLSQISREDFARKQQAARDKSMKFDWETEKTELFRAYVQVLQQSRQPGSQRLLNVPH